MVQDIRWKQRFNNFEKAFSSFQEAISIKIPTKIEQAGLIQIFEFTFELGWKTLKDLLEEEGFSPKTPRDAIKFALQAGHISDGHTWLDALEKRNLMAHTYDEEKATMAIDLIKNRYALILQELQVYLIKKV
ncbi:MAG: nucleotidyltransferase substrate binding protein [Candidatus Margulisbacteria bacterium]|nr:nucleotidyltransferase substrate binding protein [Candidatus Margulisiibacteriota bacterium]